MLWLSAHNSLSEAYKNFDNFELILFGDHVTLGFIHDLVLTSHAYYSSGLTTVKYLFDSNSVREYKVVEVLSNERLLNVILYINDLRKDFPEEYKTFIGIQVLGPNYQGTIEHLYRQLVSKLYFNEEELTEEDHAQVRELHKEEYK